LAIERAGSMSKLARKLGITRQSVRGWREIPVMRVAEVERITGIPRAELRPDVFGPVREPAE